MALRYIGQKLAQQIDEELMSASGAFSIDQLMELAGLSCAQALAKSFSVQTHKRRGWTGCCATPAPLLLHPDDLLPQTGEQGPVPTPPNSGARSSGRHLRDLAKRHQLNLPAYPGVDQVVELPPPGKL
ncbi:uncharacterized protein CcaverHIS019_0307080 [Cutaneotrichosporon cavernicola]|uniref:Uncharacterized protein n=1 Tax=Cutaneotrichosporon cavernicola TaxID=279322 RepID=A0AA48L2U6_9TREE|nr:uncharacterized protein CcaverHIS019_0307080 [Cutaneotrichosporon cavernicola]BEI90638.1 hypothetical protein CcaverHIS019_0307080 [Cutaneotrichosporon cavernicola]